MFLDLFPIEDEVGHIPAPMYVYAGRREEAVELAETGIR